jgi:hypothetical protein
MYVWVGVFLPLCSLTNAARNAPPMLSTTASMAPPYFSTLSHKQHGFRKKKKVTGHKICVFIFSSTFISNISHSEKKLGKYCHKRKNVFM